MNKNEIILTTFENGNPNMTREIISDTDYVERIYSPVEILLYEKFYKNNKENLIKVYRNQKLFLERQIEDSDYHGLSKEYNGYGELAAIEAWYKGKSVHRFNLDDLNSRQTLEMIITLANAALEYYKSKEITAEKRLK